MKRIYPLFVALSLIIGVFSFTEKAQAPKEIERLESNLSILKEQKGCLYCSDKEKIVKGRETTSQKPQLDSEYIDSGWVKEEYPKVYKFAFCESSFRPKVCSYAGCYSGMGLCGFIPSTWNATLERMKEDGVEIPLRCDEKISLPISQERDEAVFDAECNLMACQWLYRADGDSHWNSSKTCWGE